MSSLTIAIAGILTLALVLALIIVMLIRDRQKARTDFLGAISAANAVTTGLSDNVRGLSQNIAAQHGEIQKQTGVLIGLTRLLLGQEDKADRLRELPRMEGPPGSS